MRHCAPERQGPAAVDLSIATDKAQPRRRAAQRLAPAALLLASLLSACAYGPPRSERREQPHAAAPASVTGNIVVWQLAELASGDQELIGLHSGQGSYGTVAGAQIRRVARVADHLFAVVAPGSAPQVLIAGLGSVNAFAFVEDRRPTIAVTLGMLRLLGDDEDAWAALFGHELAHLRLNHLQILGEREKSAEVASSLAGAVLSAIGLPFGSVIADATATLAQRSYSRDDERDADRTGLDYMRRADFAPEGAIRLQQLLLRTGSGQGLSFLGTHPGGEERIDALRQLIQAGARTK